MYELISLISKFWRLISLLSKAVWMKSSDINCMHWDMTVSWKFSTKWLIHCYFYVYCIECLWHLKSVFFKATTYGLQKNLGGWWSEKKMIQKEKQALHVLQFCLGLPLIRRLMNRVYLIQEVQRNEILIL